MCVHSTTTNVKELLCTSCYTLPLSIHTILIFEQRLTSFTYNLAYVQTIFRVGREYVPFLSAGHITEFERITSTSFVLVAYVCDAAFGEWTDTQLVYLSQSPMIPAHHTSQHTMDYFCLFARLIATASRI